MKTSQTRCLPLKIKPFSEFNVKIICAGENQSYFVTCKPKN